MAGLAEMTFTIEWGDDPDVTVRTEGQASLEGLAEMASAVVDDPRFHSGMSGLVDHSRLDWSAMGAGELRQRVKDFAGLELRLAGCAIAVVVERPDAFGVQRMMQTLVESSTSASLGVFYSVADARTWLATVRQ